MDEYRQQLGAPERNFTISALAGTGCTELTHAIMDYLSATEDAAAAAEKKGLEASSATRAS